MEQNQLDFLNAYIALEKLCGDIFDVRNGVTAYIFEMERLNSAGIRMVKGWDESYRRLKNLRYKRNELVHGRNSFDFIEVDNTDTAWLKSFREDILNRCDPLSLLTAEKKRRSEEAAALKAKKAEKEPDDIRASKEDFKAEDKKPRGLLESLKDFILSLFKRNE